MLLCIDIEIYTCYNILKLVFNEIIKYEKHLKVKLLIKIDGMINIKTESNVKGKNKTLRHIAIIKITLNFKYKKCTLQAQ